jgi:hypothetical protein
MATTMGGVSSAMVGLSISAAGSSEGRLISRKTVDLVSAVYVPVAIIMICYALFTYEWRSKFMHKKQVGSKFVELGLLMVYNTLGEGRHD